MFWIGLIVGIVVGIIAFTVIMFIRALKRLNCSLTEYLEMMMVLVDTADNREATLACIKDDEILSEYALEDR